MIGIIGYGMVGQAVEYGFSRTTSIISDPKYNEVSVKDVCVANPDAIFVCVPTPTDSSNYSLLISILADIQQNHYTGLVVVKSTVLFDVIEPFDVLYNPEFLSRATFKQDFVSPPLLLIGGSKAEELLELYSKYSTVKTSHTFLTDIKTASLVKYIMNSFYATKLTFMNAMYDVVQECGGNYDHIKLILEKHPWMGSHHFQVPGPDGKRGFGGPCLPKDTEAFANKFDIEILKKVLEINTSYRPK